MDPLRRQVVLSLALEYKKSKDPLVFRKILKRVDKLLFSTIKVLKIYKKHLKRCSESDLYHCAVLGVHEACLLPTEDTTPEEFERILLRNIRKQIRIYYPYNRKEVLQNKTPEISIDYGSPILERNDTRILLFFSKLKKSKVITNQEFILLARRVLDNLTYVELGKEFNLAPSTMKDRLLRIVERIVSFNAGLRIKKDKAHINPDELYEP